MHYSLLIIGKVFEMNTVNICRIFDWQCKTWTDAPLDVQVDFRWCY